MSTIRAALFDLDGVIIDTESQYSEFWGAIGREFRPDVPDFAERIKGTTLESIYNNWFAHLQDELPEITRRLNDFERQMQYPYINGVCDFVKALREAGFKTAIVTASNDEKMQGVHRAHPELANLFDRILTSEDYAVGKPAPDCYLEGARGFGLLPEECVVFEDSINGLRAGRDSGAYVVALTTTNPRDAVAPLAHTVVKDFEELTLDIMQTMPLRLFYIFNHGRLLVQHTGDSYYIYRGTECPTFVQCREPHLFEQTPHTACYVCSTDEEHLPDGYEWADLRASYYLLPPHIYRQAGKAAEILYFDTHHRYCGICGGTMEWYTPISKRCADCSEEVWPQLSTAIIVLVQRGDEALLVKAKSFRRDFYGLVAGFVETGESLEECVQREVREETGLEIADIRYFGSQPWPYPMGLMVGFHANYVSGDITLADGELRDAAFFTRDNLPTIPEKLSMARMLIDEWVGESRS